MASMTMATTTVAQMVAEAKQRVMGLTANEVAAELRDIRTILVDLREPEERSQTGVIPGAIHAPRGMLEFWADPSSPYHRPELQPERRVILYCASGGRSALAADALSRLGYTNLAHLEGGIKAWREAGGTIQV
ncbi:MAG: rhodanese-like domain-containing protein [Chloroflexota bacterium]